jgi:hypothetical protein
LSVVYVKRILRGLRWVVGLHLPEFAVLMKPTHHLIGLGVDQLERES